jgi:hypothetical protein
MAPDAREAHGKRWHLSRIIPFFQTTTIATIVDHQLAAQEDETMTLADPLLRHPIALHACPLSFDSVATTIQLARTAWP